MTDTAAAMLCPVCRVPLVMSERQGVEIDYCQQCRGVWLDRGELDKIIERGTREAPPPPAAEPGRPYRDQERGYDRGYDHSHGYGHGKRRKSFLQELFD